MVKEENVSLTGSITAGITTEEMWQKMTLPLIRRVYPHLVSSKMFAVQPMKPEKPKKKKKSWA